MTRVNGAVPSLAVHDLRVELTSGDAIVEDVSLTVHRGEVLGIVGESGSGKTTTALALLGYAAPGVRIAAGRIHLDGEELLGRSEKAVRRLRGRTISYVPQDPAGALNPSRRIGDAIDLMLRTHAAKQRGRAGARSALEQVHLPADDDFARRFPHQLSGGQQQRVAIAVAIVCEPPIVVLDEPTTGLDVVTQARIIGEIDRLRREREVGLIYVSHDLAVVAQVADRIAVMYAGRVVEEGPAAAVLRRPRHPYTRGLMAAIPDPRVARRLEGIPGIAVGVGERPAGCAFAPRCPLHVPECDAAVPALLAVDAGHAARCIRWQETPMIDLGFNGARHERPAAAAILEVEGLCAEHRARRSTVRVVHDVTFQLRRGECLALVGESGSGKTTIARCLAGLHAPSAGRVVLDGEPLAGLTAKRSRQARQRLQLVFQNPNDSLNPRQRVRDEIARPARILLGLSAAEANARVAELLERVRLPARLADRFPRELSGGERQRVAIARALAARPDVMICDEITSALDVSVQAAVLELLDELRDELGLSLVFITHDLGVVSSIADRAVVLHQGRVCEVGPVRDVLDRPTHEYTRTLLASAPSLDAEIVEHG